MRQDVEYDSTRRAMFQQRGMPTVVFSGRCEVCSNSLLAEPAQLQTAARVGVYCLGQRLIAAPQRGHVDGLKKFGADLERIEQRNIRPHRRDSCPRDPHPARSGGEPGMNPGSRRCRAARQPKGFEARALRMMPPR